MPWDRETRRAAAAGLRHAARSGQFVPFVWNEAIETSRDGGTAIYGCGWGQVGWMVAVFLGGTAFARHVLPVGAEQPQVNAVLKAAGLTDDEIAYMDPQCVWEHFDRDLFEAYENREADPGTFIEVSMRLAEFFVQVIELVPENPVPEHAPHMTHAGRRVNLWASLMSFCEKKTAEAELVAA